MSGADRPATIHEQLADQLQTAAPLMQRVAVMSRQNHVDASAALEALERAIGLLRSFARDERERQRSRRSLDDPHGGSR